MAPGFFGKPLKFPLTSTWKLEGGKWCWYVGQEPLKALFGKVAGPMAQAPPGLGPSALGLPGLGPSALGPSAQGPTALGAPGLGLPAMGPPGLASPGLGPPGLGLPAAVPNTVDFILNKVKADRLSVSLKPGESEQVKFTNTALGIMELKVIGSPEDVEAKLDRTAMNAGEIATLTLQAGENPKTGTVNVRLTPTQELISISVAVD